jgi:predicted phosphodiesterase
MCQNEWDAYVRLIGDVHGEEQSYLELIKKSRYTIQIGDMHFNYSFLGENKVDAERHRFIGGNHDNYDVIGDCAHALGDYGAHDIPEFGQFFYVRGAWSIDHGLRQKHGSYKNWWQEEELTVEQGYACLKLYDQIKPKLLITHEAPYDVVQFVTNPEFANRFGYHSGVIRTKTNQLLQAMTDMHRPKMHVFGHYHKNFDEMINGTRYVCIGILQYLDLPKNFVESL